MINRKAGIIWLVLCVFATTVAISFTGGYGAGLLHANSSGVAANPGDSVDSKLFSDVWGTVKNSFVNQPVEDETLFYGALEGVAHSVDDPYTTFFKPADTEQFASTIRGEFDGIGAVIGAKDNQIVIQSVLADTPAAKAGLQSGDAVIKIDELETVGISVDEAVTHIRGEKGTTVTLTLYRNGETNVRVVPIVRDTIELPSTTYELKELNEKKVAVIALTQVDETSVADMREQVNKALIDAPAGIVLDLRNNPGGVLTGAIDIASLFIEDGIIVREEDSKGNVNNYQATGSALMPSAPNMVVLVNAGSASAAEIIAGALNDHDRAWVIGEQSFGKGSVQSYQEFEDGSSLKVTTAHWLTPNSTVIQGVGITPDQVVELTTEDYNQQRDPQLNAALEYLTK